MKYFESLKFKEVVFDYRIEALLNVRKKCLFIKNDFYSESFIKCKFFNDYFEMKYNYYNKRSIPTSKWWVNSGTSA